MKGRGQLTAGWTPKGSLTFNAHWLELGRTWSNMRKVGEKGWSHGYRRIDTSCPDLVVNEGGWELSGVAGSKKSECFSVGQVNKLSDWESDTLRVAWSAREGCDLLVVGRLGVGGFDAVDLDGFKGVADFLLERLDLGEASALVEDDLIELIVLMLEVSEVRFDFSEAVGKFLIHE